jgi:hypothetical protein
MAQKQLYSNLQTRPPVREGSTKLQTRNCLKEISRRKKNWSQVPDGRLTPGQTGRQTVGRKLTACLPACLSDSRDRGVNQTKLSLCMAECSCIIKKRLTLSEKENETLFY